MEKPILFRCEDCKCYTVLYENSHVGKVHFTPNFCGHCGAENPATKVR